MCVSRKGRRSHAQRTKALDIHPIAFRTPCGPCHSDSQKPSSPFSYSSFLLHLWISPKEEKEKRRNCILPPSSRPTQKRSRRRRRRSDGKEKEKLFLFSFLQVDGKRKRGRKEGRRRDMHHGFGPTDRPQLILSSFSSSPSPFSLPRRKGKKETDPRKIERDKDLPIFNWSNYYTKQTYLTS